MVKQDGPRYAPGSKRKTLSHLLQPVAHLSQQHQYWFGQSSLRLDMNMFVKWKNFAQSSLYKRKNKAGNQDQSRVKSTEACSGNRQDT